MPPCGQWINFMYHWSALPRSVVLNSTNLVASLVSLSVQMASQRNQCCSASSSPLPEHSGSLKVFPDCVPTIVLGENPDEPVGSWLGYNTLTCKLTSLGYYRWYTTDSATLTTTSTCSRLITIRNKTKTIRMNYRYLIIQRRPRCGLGWSISTAVRCSFRVSSSSNRRRIVY